MMANALTPAPVVPNHNTSRMRTWKDSGISLAFLRVAREIPKGGGVPADEPPRDNFGMLFSKRW
jgi:hypothetical protein